MHRLNHEAPYIYEQLRKDNGDLEIKIATLLDRLLVENSIISQQTIHVTSAILDDTYFILLDSDDAKAYDYFYAARLLSAKEFVDENNLVDAVYELIHAFEDKEKIKQCINNFLNSHNFTK